jgi:bifunctional non-homologous end joining protein LigD
MLAWRTHASSEAGRYTVLIVLPGYTPMTPSLVRAPFHRDGWIYEEKVDGWRILAYKDDKGVRLISRNGRDHTRRFHDIVAAVAKLSARKLVLDGEVAMYDQKLRSRFEWLREPDEDAIATPPVFMAFDLLLQDGRELTGRPLRDRRAQMEIVVAGSEFVLPARRLATNGFEAWAEVIENDYEGLVAKEEASLYEPGPTQRWLKVKQKGWTDAEDRWQRRISAGA